MANKDDLPTTNVSWALGISNRVANEVKRLRKARGLTVQQLADRTAEIGHPLTRLVITKLETGRRGEHLQVSDVVALAWALNVPPVSLLYPAMPDGEVELVPGEVVSSISAAAWFSGELKFSPEIQTKEELGDDEEWQRRAELHAALHTGYRLIELSRERLMLRAQIDSLTSTIHRLRAADEEFADGLVPDLAEAQARLRKIEEQLLLTPGAVVRDGG